MDFQNIINLLMGRPHTSTFAQRFAAADPFVSPSGYPMYLEAKQRGWTPQNIWLDAVNPNDKYDDKPTPQQVIRQNMDAIAKDRAVMHQPALDPDTLIQLLNPGQKMGSVSGADLPTFRAPDVNMLNSPNMQMYNYYNPEDQKRS